MKPAKEKRILDRWECYNPGKNICTKKGWIHNKCIYKRLGPNQEYIVIAVGYNKETEKLYVVYYRLFC